MLIPCFDVWSNLSDVVDVLMQSYLTGNNLLGGTLLVTHEGETVITAVFMDRLDKHFFHIDYFEQLVHTAVTKDELEKLNTTRYCTDSTLYRHIELNRSYCSRIVGPEIERLLRTQHGEPDARVKQHLELVARSTGSTISSTG